MFNEVFTTGMSSMSVSRSTKGDYSYEIKIYHSGKGKAPFAAIKRIDEMRRDLEKRLGISGPDEEAVGNGGVAPVDDMDALEPEQKQEAKPKGKTKIRRVPLPPKNAPKKAPKAEAAKDEGAGTDKVEAVKDEGGNTDGN